MDTIETLQEFHDGRRKLRICEVSAHMPSVVKACYCHLRIYHDGDSEPYGNELRKQTDGVDYWGFSRVNVPYKKSLRSLYGRVYEAVRLINETMKND